MANLSKEVEQLKYERMLEQMQREYDERMNDEIYLEIKQQNDEKNTISPTDL